MSRTGPASIQGSSLALVGAYMLAGELATCPDYASAFDAYEQATRPFVELDQALVHEGDARLLPSTAEALAKRNAALRELTTLPADTRRAAHTALQLREFSGSARLHRRAGVLD